MTRSRRPSSRTAAIIAAVFLALHLLPLLWRPNPLWGTELLSYLPPLYQFLFILCGVLLFVPAFRNQIRAWFRAIPLALWEPGRRAWLARGLILGAALALFAALRTATHLLGDGDLYVRDLEAGVLGRTQRAPLAFALLRVLHGIGGGLWETAENTFRVYSYASGGLYVLLAFPVARAIGTTSREKSVVLAFLLTAGYVQLFFGYVETYALCVPGILLYLLLGLRVLDDRMPIYLPALLLGLLVNLHLALAFLGPSLLVLAWRSYRSGNRLAAVIGLCLPLSGVALFQWLTGLGLLEYLSGKGGGYILPVLAEPGFRESYRLFSISHFLDFFNVLILAAPAACMALCLLKKRDLGRHPFLLAGAGFPLLFTFLANPEIGAFRDWDLLALPAVPLTLWAASALLARMRGGNGAFPAAFLICGAAALHSLAWTGVNAWSVAAEARYINLMDGLTGHAASYGWETLGSYYRRQGEPAYALGAYRRALEANPDNPRHWGSVGSIHYTLGEYEESIPYFVRAIEINPGLAKAYLHLGMACLNTDRLEEGRGILQAFLTLSPDDPRAPEIRRLLESPDE